jgi:hypothetical protein
MQIEHFSSSVAGAFRRLTSLDLSSNAFTHLPVALSQITTLRTLDLSYNNLQLEYSDADTLAALPHLQELILAKKANGSPSHHAFSQESVGSLIAIGRQFPSLELHVYS